MATLSASSTEASIKHLNIHDLEIRSTVDKGRGVYATHPILERTLVEISPVILFTPDEWDKYGQHTVLDHYTFVWRTPGQPKPSMALALGLGSMFNHASRPNVSFHRNIVAQTIEYTTTRDIASGEELCICYGDTSRLWFPTADSTPEGNGDEGEGWLSSVGDVVE